MSVKSNFHLEESHIMYNSFLNLVKIYLQKLGPWGNCSQCSCVGFVKDSRNENICERCGHSYSEHY